MATIGKEEKVFTVMIEIDVDKEVASQYEAISLQWAPFFESRPGFVSQTVHRSHDGTKFITYLQWKSEQDHLNCKNAGEMDPESEFGKLMRAGNVRMIDRTYDVIYSS